MDLTPVRSLLRESAETLLLLLIAALTLAGYVGIALALAGAMR